MLCFSHRLSNWWDENRREEAQQQGEVLLSDAFPRGEGLSVRHVCRKETRCPPALALSVLTSANENHAFLMTIACWPGLGLVKWFCHLCSVVQVKCWSVGLKWSFCFSGLKPNLSLAFLTSVFHVIPSCLCWHSFFPPLCYLRERKGQGQEYGETSM